MENWISIVVSPSFTEQDIQICLKEIFLFSKDNVFKIVTWMKLHITLLRHLDWTISLNARIKIIEIYLQYTMTGIVVIMKYSN